MSYYKYLTEERALEMLKNGSIRFTQACELNDVFELYPVFDNSNADFIFKKPTKRFTNEMNRISNLIPNTDEFRNIKRFLSMDNYDFINNMEDNQLIDFINSLISDSVIRAIRNGLGILSLTIEKDIILMWSHYADNHKGVVIELDSDNPFFGDSIVKNRNVKYPKKRINTKLSNISLENILFTKSPHWRYEKEIRIVRSIKDLNLVSNYRVYDSNGNNKEIYTASFPPEMVKAIYFGAENKQNNCGSKYRKQIIEIIKDKYSHVEVHQGELSRINYQLEFKQLKSIR